VELKPWIDRTAGRKEGERLGLNRLKPVAKLLGESPRTVYAWYRLERAPCFRSALNIVIASRREVDFNGIYGPFAAAAVKVEGGRCALA